MAYHEFAIMPTAPGPNERFDTYEPEKYTFIRIHDDEIEPLLPQFETISCYYHTVQQPGMNLAYCGITLIPPQSVEAFLNIIESQNRSQYEEIIGLLQRAKETEQYIIHFGI